MPFSGLCDFCEFATDYTDEMTNHIFRNHKNAIKNSVHHVEILKNALKTKNPVIELSHKNIVCMVCEKGKCCFSINKEERELFNRNHKSCLDKFETVKELLTTTKEAEEKHNERRLALLAQAEVKKTISKCICPKCNHDFNGNKYNLKRHLAANSCLEVKQDIKHICEECGFEASRKDSLNRHKKGGCKGKPKPKNNVVVVEEDQAHNFKKQSPTNEQGLEDFPKIVSSPPPPPPHTPPHLPPHTEIKNTVIYNDINKLKEEKEDLEDQNEELHQQLEHVKKFLQKRKLWDQFVQLYDEHIATEDEDD